MPEETSKQSWWQTMPGILTATAGIITAVTGFVLAVNQLGCFHNNADKKTAAYADTGNIHKPQNQNIIQQEVTKDNTAVVPDTSSQIKNIDAGNDDEINLLAPENGGQILVANSDDWRRAIDGKDGLANAVFF